MLIKELFENKNVEKMSPQEEKQFCGNNVGNLFHRYCTYSLFKKENISFIYPEIEKDLLKEI